MLENLIDLLLLAEPSEQVTGRSADVLLDQGVLGVVAIGFAVLLWWVIKSASKREERLVAVIEKREDQFVDLVERVAETSGEVASALEELRKCIEGMRE